MFIKSNAQDSALEQILKLIQHKEIFPGTRLFETDLEKTLGMSRTPIRGALDQMVVDGILQKKREQRGYLFPKLSSSDLYEAYIFRERLEVLSVTLAFLKWSKNASKSLQEALNIENSISTVRLADTYKSLSNGFHITLANISDNTYLIRSLKQVYLRICIYELFYGVGMYRIRREEDVNKDINDKMFQQHINIINSIEQRNLNTATMTMISHLRQTALVKEYVKSVSEWESYNSLFPLND